MLACIRGIKIKGSLFLHEKFNRVRFKRVICKHKRIPFSFRSGQSSEKGIYSYINRN